MTTIEPHTEKSKYLDFYKLILDNSRDVIYFLEVIEDGRFIHIEINQAYVEITGIPREDIIGKYVDEFENESFKEILLQKFNSCLSERTKIEHTGEYNFPSGIKIFHSVHTPIWNERGEITNIIGIARDITESIKQEEALKHSEQELRTLMDNLPDNIVGFGGSLSLYQSHT